MSNGFVHLFRPDAGAATDQLQACLLGQGLGLRLYVNTQDLGMAIGRAAGAGEPHLVLLVGELEINCRAARAVREVDPCMGMVALLPSLTEPLVVQALSCGIDACWPQGLPPQHVTEGVCRYLSRQSVHPDGQAANRPAQGGWQLESRAWVLRCPRGTRVSLTTAERALILALCHAPAGRASHVDLIQAVARSAGEGPQPDSILQHAWPAARRLSVLVSRLRHKLSAAGLESPIRSLRGVGYELCVELECPDLQAEGSC